MNKDDIIISLAALLSTYDIDEMICKNVDKPCPRGEYGDESDEYDCYDCIIKYVSTPCRWKADNDVCVNGDCKEHCADFVSPEHCAICKYKEVDAI